VELVVIIDIRLDLPSDDQRIALVTRYGTASRSAGLNAEKLYTVEVLRQMEEQTDLGEPDFTHNDLEHDISLTIENDSNGNFSRDAFQSIRRIPIAKREIPIIQSGTTNVPCILVYGIVHDLVVQVSIYMTQTYRNVIGIDVPLTPERSATFYTIELDTVDKFLQEYFDKTPITVELDDSDGSDTEAY
jgi:hypothetical protein